MKRILAAALLIAVPATAQQADPETDTDAEVVVTGRGLAAPPGDAAYAVVTLDRERLTGGERLENVLRDVAGLAQFRRSDARSANPTSQGVTLRGLGGNASSRALVLLDGVPQADPFGGWIAFPALMPARLAGVRVTRGGGSGYAGPGALAGTIELSSLGRDADALSAVVGYGSRDALDAGAVGRATLGDGFATLAANYARGDGFVPIVGADRGPIDRASPYEQLSGALRTVFPVGAATELQANVAAFSDDRDRGTPLSAISSQGADASVRVVGRGAWRWSVLGYLQTRTLATQFVSIDAARTTATATLDQYNTPATGLGGRIELAPPLGGGLTLRLGGDARGVAGKSEELFTFVAGRPTRRREAGGRTLSVGAFADLSLERGPLTLSAGGRIDRWWIADGRLEERPLAGGAALTDLDFATRTGWEPTGRAGLAWRATDTVALRLAGYRGWRLPTLNELYRPFRVGADATAANPALTPERLDGIEGGLDWSPAAGVSVRATGFVNRLDRAIANVTLASGPGTFPGVGFVAAGGTFRQRRNLSAIVARGVELDAKLRRGDWRLGLGYALTDARTRADGLAAALDRLRPAQTARHSAAATLGWSRGDTDAALTAHYVGRQFEDDQNLRRLDDAFTLDAQLTVPLGRGLSLTGRVENLADARVEAGVAATGVVERATPRTLWLGIGYRLR
ncbi:MAG: TonB-dependent receptor [Pseudomonadota bacterium]